MVVVVIDVLDQRRPQPKINITQFQGHQAMNSHPTRPRIGVIGGGHLGRIHAKLLAINPDCEFIGVADPSEHSRDLVHSQLNLSTVPNYQAWAETLDAAIVAAPTFLHHEIGTWCLIHGIDVLMEKPIASSLREASKLVQLAQTNQRVLQVGHVERFNPAWMLAAKQLDFPSIRYVEAVREGTYTGRSTDIGIVLDLMIHDIDLILSAIDSPVEHVNAFGWSVLGEHEDFATANIRFKNGSVAQLRASRVSPVAKRHMQIYSEEGLTELDLAAGVVSTTFAVPDVANGKRQADQLSAELRSKVKDNLYVEWLNKQEYKAEPCNAIALEQNEFITAVTGNASVTVSGEHGYRALELATRILDEIDANKPARSVIPSAARFGQSKAA